MLIFYKPIPSQKCIAPYLNPPHYLFNVPFSQSTHKDKSIWETLLDILKY